MDSHGFIDVEPHPEPIYGGAAAQPFTTHHNTIAPGSLPCAFVLSFIETPAGWAVGSGLRNRPRFPQRRAFPSNTILNLPCLSFIGRYADYLKVMEFTEQMVSTVAREVLNTQKSNSRAGNLTDPAWKRVELRQGYFGACGIDSDQYPRPPLC
jgi:lysyl-tRNA synthetase class 2